MTGLTINSVAAHAFRRGGASCLLAVPLEIYGPTISATRPIRVVDDTYLCQKVLP